MNACLIDLLLDLSDFFAFENSVINVFCYSMSSGGWGGPVPRGRGGRGRARGTVQPLHFGGAGFGKE